MFCIPAFILLLYAIYRLGIGVLVLIGFPVALWIAVVICIKIVKKQVKLNKEA